ncbi:signal peptidase I [Teredinibacter purpureus]|uniref:signal peptidase I n=1 Tax=Teredinibacter purpureus TaxID=2731756 RepID=UPI0005F86A23|nr:signal peptidase I [Teredinibacter purpureus]
MDINLPLILMLAVAGTGMVWLYDIVMLKKSRRAAIANVDARFPHLTDAQKEKDEGYVKAYMAVAAEPSVVEFSKSFFPVLFLVFFLRSFIIEPFQIPSESMVPTLEVGDFIAVNKFAYGVRMPVFRNKIIPVSDPKRGDVMVFFPPHRSQYFIKRVIGLPGDKIRYTNNVLYINGVEAEQTLVLRETIESVDFCSARGGSYLITDENIDGETHRMRKCTIPGRLSVNGSWDVPQGHYLMIGDNRDNSSDGRDWGFVPEDRIVGKAFAIWMHWDKFLSLPSFSRTGSI